MATENNQMNFSDQYLDAYFKDTPYYDQYRALNAKYAQDMRDYQGTFAGSITGQNKRDINQLHKDYTTAITDLVNLMATNEYNSPAEQVKREKAAGLNPDLTGVSNTGLSEGSEVPNTPYAPDTAFQQVSSFLSTIGTALVGASNFIPTLQNNLLSVKANRLQYAKEMDSYIIQSLSDLGPDVLNYDKDKEIAPSFSLGFTNLSRRERKKADERAKFLAETLATRGRQYGTKLEHDRNRRDIFDVRSSVGFSDDDEEFFKTLAPEMAELAQIIFEAEGIASAESAWATHDEAKNRRTIAKIMSMEKGIMNTIKQYAEKGNVFAAGVVMSMFAPNSAPPSNQLLDLAKLFLKKK